MLFNGRYERARKLQREQAGLKDESEYRDYDGEKLYEPTIEDNIEKGDMFALMVSGIITILPIACLALLAVVAAGFLFFRLF